uniref:Uncharacterized protein n=1 Tax=Chromera velia CCMP2878 TaxID=1169474 RepID=A0A0G4FXX0_9ALVE|eukprot:Cvel_19177.t1-p1 / transcript=Cvel_19177.t1 / gene=Cvel_19177 / organism=Chromera_velia_CCMP2878 / gene_product=Zinc finger protein 571, putative / transcript_product=Zinc finger protein 571, putative / location=Cvel_scaffold1635:14133-14939(+) / protein_length=226 / sequence_SO=supercontig / SO=protein_coding / is_pseudo=false
MVNVPQTPVILPRHSGVPVEVVLLEVGFEVGERTTEVLVGAFALSGGFAFPDSSASLASMLADAATPALLTFCAHATVFANPTPTALSTYTARTTVSTNRTSTTVNAGVLDAPVCTNSAPPTLFAISMQPTMSADRAAPTHSTVMTPSPMFTNPFSSAVFVLGVLTAMYAHLCPPALLAIMLALASVLANSAPSTISAKIFYPTVWAQWSLPTVSIRRSSVEELLP